MFHTKKYPHKFSQKEFRRIIAPCMWSDALIKKIEFTFRSDETNSTDVLHLFNMVLREFYQEKEEAAVSRLHAFFSSTSGIFLSAYSGHEES